MKDLPLSFNNEMLKQVQHDKFVPNEFFVVRSGLKLNFKPLLKKNYSSISSKVRVSVPYEKPRLALLNIEAKNIIILVSGASLPQ